ncbi:MAG TPA: hypothetical protein VGM76_13145 [Lacipirellulaceae bacterium]
MRLHAGQIYVVLVAFVAAGSIGARVGSAQEVPRTEPTKTMPTMSPEDARRMDEEVLHANQDAIQAGKAAKYAAKAAAGKAREIQLQISTPIATNVFGNPIASKIRSAAEELRDAANDESRDKANTKLRDLLDQYFEEDMVQRQQELEGIEARLQKLHSQLEHRRAKKQDIIDLELKMSVNEADGLGFYSQPTGGSFFNPIPAGVFPLDLTPPSPPVSPPGPATPAVMPTGPASYGVGPAAPNNGRGREGK